ncbi:sugar ABC transporter permease YjfF [Saccharophagus sp. K07]|uniref:galactofuranose ABC transporter, permease protein YjfF n=1 Tax=Saccharophagus sp. K07 TaxID=2283636 RepID=UPI0016529C7B|nr:galactofuranose ABC transporter, permease protein YjfF [Saccharophagus sp. K07]MBC6904083.1 sugar ABC transporter permease YjfF [Saccharophagus sp. K07]
MSARFIPVVVTAVLFLALLIAGSLQFSGFASPRVLLNLLTDNSFLAIMALGMTFVILSGGIDLSVGSVLALSSVLCAILVEKHGWHPLQAIPVVLIAGAAFGAIMGALIHVYKLQPFIVTLAGMFFARGLATVLSEQSIPITHSFFDSVNNFGFSVLGGWIGSATLLLIVVFAFGLWLAHFTRLGGYIYALGGNSTSAALLGVPMGLTTISIYTLSSTLAALSGIVYTFYTASGYALSGVGMELDAIAAVVIGGTLLTGGYGYVLGTLLGVMIMGLIQTWISFHGSLNSWWTKIFIGSLVLAFIIFQRGISAGFGTKKAKI